MPANSSPLLITIDGPAGVGKSTIAKRLADELGVAYLDTGAMFRATAWKLGENAWNLPEQELEHALQALEFTLSGGGSGAVLSVNNTPLTDAIRTEEVGMWASNLATLPLVREFQKTAQQTIGAAVSLVAEGRDMGTVIFPNAPHKFFLDADVEERAQRRYLQLKQMNKPADLAQLADAIRKRDEQDRNRLVAPLKPADDAQIIDTTVLSINQVEARIISVIRGEEHARSA